MELVTKLREISIFRNLKEEWLQQLAELTDRVMLPANATVMEEGDVSGEFYHILSGEVEIIKRADSGEYHRIRTLQAGDLIGELVFIEEAPRSATIRTLMPTELLRIDGKKIKNDPRYLELYVQLTLQMGKSLSERLRYTNKVTVKAMQAEVVNLKSQVALGKILILLVVMVSIYIFALGIVLRIKELLPSTTLISVIMILLYAVSMFGVLRRSGYPLSAYGFNLKNWPTQVREAIQYTGFLMMLLVLFKWIGIHTISQFSDYPLFQPLASIQGHTDHIMFIYFLTLFAYSLFSPIQEFIVRGGLQSSFQLFLKHKTWISIILSNLLFASMHIHTTFAFAMLAFIPGLFWGWLYSRHRSLLGVSISHILLGVWATFIVGLPGIA